jgi:hypothetical protein
MSLRPALTAAGAVVIALWATLTLCRWDSGGQSHLSGLAQEVQHGQELESHVEAGRRCYEAKRALAVEVVAGKLSLHEAAGHFRRLEEADASYPPDSPRPPGDEQAVCERLLHFIWDILAERELFAAAARQYSEAFAAHPPLLAGPPTGHRCRAACAAARRWAGCGPS